MHECVGIGIQSLFVRTMATTATPLCVPNAKSTPSRRRFEEFMRWIDTEGEASHSAASPAQHSGGQTACLAKHGDVELRLGPYGATAFARTTIPAGSVIMRLPRRWVLDARAARASPWGQAASNVLGGEAIPARLLLYLTMIGQRACDDTTKAPWGPYLRAIPRSFDTLLYWSAEELEWLSDTGVIATLRSRAKALRAAYKRLCRPLVKARPDVFDKETFTWCVHVCSTPMISSSQACSSETIGLSSTTTCQ